MKIIMISIIKRPCAIIGHGWDKIFIKMIKLCGKTKATPLKLIF